MIRALLVDDEEPARTRLRDMLGEHGDVSVVGEARDGAEALSRIGETRPDVVFLDIDMPGLNGLEVAGSLAPPRPRVVFCTAWDRYAVDAFEHHALDYLLKPLSRERLGRALARLRADPAGGELTAATRTQARLLPQRAPAMAGLDCDGLCRPARGVGGDYYDFLALGPGRVALAVGDVSGKGLFAGLLVAALQARVQSLAPLFGLELAALAGEVNRLVHDSTDSNRYATFFYGVYDEASRQLHYVNAGHVPPFVFRAGDASAAPLRLREGGTAVGLLPDARYRQDRVRLEPGDIAILCSDGLTEAAGAGGEEFGELGLAAAVRRHAGLAAAALRDGIVAELDGFRGAATPEDDLTLVVARPR